MKFGNALGDVVVMLSTKAQEIVDYLYNEEISQEDKNKYLEDFLSKCCTETRKKFETTRDSALAEKDYVKMGTIIFQILLEVQFGQAGFMKIT